ncbi:hypothetical protein FRC01_013482, partial [Tulasnella sp. 417]
MPLEIARLILTRSQMHPLSINSRAYGMRFQLHKPCNEDEILEMALGHSTRVKCVNVRVHDLRHSNLQKLLKAPTPALETLKVHADYRRSFELGASGLLDELTPSEGTPLKRLSLHDVPTRLDHPRLSNLITLKLSQGSVPHSPEPLLHLLSCSQRLEVLDISGLTESIQGVRATAPILLQHLNTLSLREMPGKYTATILASICTPSCSVIKVRDNRVRASEDAVVVEELDAIVWKPGNHQAVTLVGGPDSSKAPSMLNIGVSDGCVLVESHGMVGGELALEFNRAHIPRFMAHLAETLSQIPYPPVVYLRCGVTGTTGHIPVDLLAWSEVLESLAVVGQ